MKVSGVFFLVELLYGKSPKHFKYFGLLCSMAVANCAMKRWGGLFPSLYLDALTDGWGDGDGA